MQTPKKFMATMFLKARASHPCQRFPVPLAACEDHVPAGSEDFYRCLDIRKSGGQAVASEQQELTRERGKTRYKCASGCAESRAPRAVSRCCSTGLTLRSLALTGSLDSVPSL